MKFFHRFEKEIKDFEFEEEKLFDEKFMCDFSDGVKDILQMKFELKIEKKIWRKFWKVENLGELFVDFQIILRNF